MGLQQPGELRRPIHGAVVLADASHVLLLPRSPTGWWAAGAQLAGVSVARGTE